MKYVSVTSDKSKRKAFKLCLCGGIIGLHDFYLGRYISGIVKMFTLNFCLLGWIVDMIKIASGGYKDNSKAYLRR